MDLCFKNDVRECFCTACFYSGFMCSELVLHHYPLWVSWLQSSSVEMIWMPLSSLKSAFFDKCFTSELHIMEQKPWGHNLNTPAPQLTRKKGKKWAWLAAEESTLPILNFAQHHPDKLKKKNAYRASQLLAKLFSSACRETLIWMTSCSLLIGWRICSR